jgi:hypothetical protein
MAAVVACSAAGSAWALEGDGLVPQKDPPWPRWQARLSLGTSAPLQRYDPMNADSRSLKPSGVTLLGDYYFTRSLPRLGDSGGFRATGGMFLGSRSTSLLSIAPNAGLGGRAFSVDRRTVGGLSLSLGGESPSSESGAVPYVGVGYTGLPSKGGWGFSADLGLMAVSPGSAVKLGRGFTGGQNLDDALRDMRFSPLVQVGVSYSF